MKALIERLAAIEGVTVNRWCRDAIRDKLKKESSNAKG
jgi:hypothetical protein